MAVLIKANSGLPSTSQKARYSSGGIPSYPGDLPFVILTRAFLNSSREMGVLSNSDLLSDREGRLRS